MAEQSQYELFRCRLSISGDWDSTTHKLFLIPLEYLMKWLALLLNIYFFVLLIQPAVMSLPPVASGADMCCTSGGDEASCERQEPGGQNDLCNSGRCNPLFSQCPLFHCTLSDQPGSGLHSSYATTGSMYAMFSSGVIEGHSRDVIHPPECC